MGEKRGMKGLETWCRRVTHGYPGVKVDNMTTSWRDGLAFCALIHHFRPDLINFESLDKDDVYGNNELAYRVAEEYLGIPALLDAEDMVEYAVPDRLSILTYLSQFYRAFVTGHQGSSQSQSPTRAVPKRPATLSERGVTSPLPEGPPSKKLPHVLPAVRREPCASCGLPVFIAERLIVGGHTLYHRSCFRCARCQHQLSLANCYETEDGRYCCETCPDEVGKDASDSPAPRDETLGASSENDKYSATFETAVEDPAVPEGDPVKTERVSSTSLARSNFMSSQLLSSEPDDSPVPVDAPSVQASKDKRPDDAMIGMLSPADVDASATSITSSVSVRSSDSLDTTAGSGELSPQAIDTKDSHPSLSIVQLRLKMFEKSGVHEAGKDNAKESTTSPNRQSRNVVQQGVVLAPVAPTSREDDNLCDGHKNDVPYETQAKVDEQITSPSRNKEAVTDLIVSSSPGSMTEKLGNDVALAGDAKEKNSHEIFVKENVHNVVENVSFEEDREVDNSRKEDPSLEVSIVSASPKKKSVDSEQGSYPVDLNPFGDEEEEEVGGGERGLGPTVVVTEAVNLRVGGPPRPAARSSTGAETHKKSLNPFWSDGEEPDSDEEREGALPQQRKAPVPCPRTSRNPDAEALRDPSPLPRSLGVKVGSVTSLSSLGSSAGGTPSGTAQRKKKLAPPPPACARDLFPKSPDSSRASSPTSSTVQSPQVARRHRKSRQAPLPPSTNPLPPSWNLVKEDKNATNRIRQNGIDAIVGRPAAAVMPNKSVSGQWKRKKGPAPARPVPQRRQIHAMPMKEVRQELEDIEVQQLELERQGVALEQTIRSLDQGTDPPDSNFTPDVEDLVLQLFELVNEKNELFRRQAELMYLRRQQRLEEEHADLEYQIRCLLERPDHGKTDSDKAREEELIQRLVEVVERRNEIVECLEMDRRREVEEDRSIHHQLGIFAAKKNYAEDVVLAPSKDVENCPGEKADKRKSRKKDKHSKKKSAEKMDADKDVDEVELSMSKLGKEKKSKKRWFH